MSVISTCRLWFQHTQEWFLHAKCDFDTNECDYDTHTCKNHTIRVKITLVCVVYTHTVINTSTSVISERKVWFKHARVWFLHAECNFHTQCNVEMHNCEYGTYDIDFNTHKSGSYTQIMMLTRMSVIMTLTNMRMALIRVKTTLCARRNHCFVWCWHAYCDDHTHECNF
jgi:hypothetical protein